jgi:hypothetical protein
MAFFLLSLLTLNRRSMNKSILVRLLFAAGILMLIASSCKKEQQHGQVSFRFSFAVDGQSMQTDTMIYINEAGNHYMINTIQYFISEILFQQKDNYGMLLMNENGIHYIDSDLPETQLWQVTDQIPTGTYDSITFLFGLSEYRNKSNFFTDPPESNMFWPDQLGGGYHYMKFDGKYLDSLQQVTPFNFHLGIGQTYDYYGNITGFIQNYFRVNLPGSAFSLAENEKKEINIVMNVDSWFKTPHTWDFNHWGGMIMQNQAAMKTACDNGYDVFTVASIRKSM